MILKPFNIFSLLVQTLFSCLMDHFCSLQKLYRFASAKGSKVVSDILWPEARWRKMQISVSNFRGAVSTMELPKLFEESSNADHGTKSRTISVNQDGCSISFIRSFMPSSAGRSTPSKCSQESNLKCISPSSSSKGVIEENVYPAMKGIVILLDWKKIHSCFSHKLLSVFYIFYVHNFYLCTIT